MKTINLFFINLFLFFYIFSYSQENKSNVLFQNDNSVKYENGTVLISYIGTFHGRNFEISSTSYSPYLLGVYYDDNEEINPKMYKIPIKTSGMTYVKYNTENGIIHAGDPVTSSSVSGEAMKATQPGMILGVALEDATNSNGLVKIRILIQYMR